MADKRKLATITNPMIEAATGGLFRFKEKTKALEKLEAISKHFVTARNQPGDSDTLRLWIKGYALTDKERKQGYRGHFALLSCIRVDDTRWTITATKEAVDLKQHPERKRSYGAQPDWGHPILREIKKQKQYATIEEAEEYFIQLHEAFPDASIPGHGKLYLMVYERLRNPAMPVQKYIFKIIPAVEGAEDGPFIIHYIANPKAKKAPTVRKKPTVAPEQREGYFAKMVSRKRKK